MDRPVGSASAREPRQADPPDLSKRVSRVIVCRPRRLRAARGYACCPALQEVQAQGAAFTRRLPKRFEEPSGRSRPTPLGFWNSPHCPATCASVVTARTGASRLGGTFSSGGNTKPIRLPSGCGTSARASPQTGPVPGARYPSQGHDGGTTIRGNPNPSTRMILRLLATVGPSSSSATRSFRFTSPVNKLSAVDKQHLRPAILRGSAVNKLSGKESLVTRHAGSVGTPWCHLPVASPGKPGE